MNSFLEMRALPTTSNHTIRIYFCSYTLVSITECPSIIHLFVLFETQTQTHVLYCCVLNYRRNVNMNSALGRKRANVYKYLVKTYLQYN
jgi:hypothetical protein